MSPVAGPPPRSVPHPFSCAFKNASSAGEPIRRCAFITPHGPVLSGHGAPGLVRISRSHASRSSAPARATGTSGLGEYAQLTSGSVTHPRRFELTYCAGSLASCLYHISSENAAAWGLYNTSIFFTIFADAPSAPMPNEHTSFSRTATGAPRIAACDGDALAANRRLVQA